MEEVRIVETAGSHLLVERRGRFAVIERRNGRVYGTEDGERRGEPDTPAGMAAAVGEGGWMDEAHARQAFAAIAREGERLARKIW